MKKPTKAEKQKNLRDIQFEIKSSRQRLFEEENKDLHAVLGTRQSFSSHDKQRAHLYFESKDDAKKRISKKRKINTNHDFDSEGLLQYVRSLPDESLLNLTKCAGVKI